MRSVRGKHMESKGNLKILFEWGTGHAECLKNFLKGAPGITHYGTGLGERLRIYKECIKCNIPVLVRKTV